MRFFLLVGLVTWHVANFNVAGDEEWDDKGLAAVTLSANTFSTNFYSTVARGVSENLICSPLSTSIALSMLAYGAGGNTETELRKVLALPANDELALRGFWDLIESFDKIKNIDLRLANKVFLADKFVPRYAFSFLTEAIFRSEAMSVDFGKPVETSNTINEWAEIETNHCIKDLIKPNNIDSSTLLVLANAVYFKGEWESKFDADKTNLSIFHINRQVQKNVSTMYQYGSYRYGELPELKAKFVELPYKGESWTEAMSMFIILPDEIDGIAELEKSFEKITLDTLSSRHRDVHVHLPRFKIESEIQLEAPLMEMGLNDMFLDRANFSGIAENAPMKVTKILQKAFIEVNEEGTEAAAVNAGQLDSRIFNEVEPPVSFIADHPFISIIATQGANPTILFIARYTGNENMEEK